MAYAEQNTNYTAQNLGGEIKKPSLIGDSADLRTRLAKIYERVGILGDQLLGSEPSPVGADGAPEPSPTVHRNLQRCHETVGAIENALRRIEGRL